MAVTTEHQRVVDLELVVIGLPHRAFFAVMPKSVSALTLGTMSQEYQVVPLLDTENGNLSFGPTVAFPFFTPAELGFVESHLPAQESIGI